MAMSRNEVIGRAFGMSSLQLVQADEVKAGQVPLPGLPLDVIAVLRKASMDAHRDPEYLAFNEKAKPVISPLDGEKVQEIVTRVTKTPAALVARYKRALEIK